MNAKHQNAVVFIICEC